MLALTARLVDLLMIVLGGTVAHLIWGQGQLHWWHVEVFLMFFSCVAALLLFPSLGVYQSWRGKPINGLVVRVLFGWAIVLTLGIAVLFGVQRTQHVSRGWLGAWAVLTAVLFVAAKYVFYNVLRRIRREGLNQRAVVIVGSGGYCRTLLSRIRTAPYAGFRAVCVLNEDVGAEPSDGRAVPAQISGIPVLTDFSDLVRMVRQRRVHEIWLAMPLSEERNIMRYMREFRNDFVSIRFIPDVRSLSLFNHTIVDLLGVPAINLTASEVPDIQVLPKLIFDRMFAFVVILMLLPLLTTIALAVRLSSKGPVFFKQKRKGIDGREFEIYKFRSMRVHAEAAGTVTQAKRSDPRITKVGAFLRKTSLDELPQFINVLRGEMSVVGPRPHAIAHDDLYKDQVEGYMYRYRIKPGITGWAQVNGYRGETDRVEKMEARVKFDLYYIQHWSFWFDMRIVLLTIVKGFIGSNAY